MREKVAIEISLLQGQFTVVKVTGFMNMSQVGLFESKLDTLIVSGVTKIILDFRELDYISSAGLGTMVSRIRDIREKAGDIKIGGCSAAVNDILDVFGFNKVFSLAETPEQAAALFSTES